MVSWQASWDKIYPQIEAGRRCKQFKDIATLHGLVYKKNKVKGGILKSIVSMLWNKNTVQGNSITYGTVLMMAKYSCLLNGVAGTKSNMVM